VKHAIIGHRYAQALLATVAQDDYPSLFSDVQYLCTALVEHPRLHSILSSRILHPEQRTQLLNALLEETMHREIWDNLFAILAKKAKMEIFPAILKDLEAKVLRAQGKQKFRLTLAHEQSDAVMQKIRTVVEIQYTQKCFLILPSTPRCWEVLLPNLTPCASMARFKIT